MTRPKRDEVAHAHAVLERLDPYITIDQVRDLVRCAEVSGLSVGQWILECARVKAASVIDAAQGADRRRRTGRTNQR